ncbi:MAG: hypothetical protein JO051_16460 [Acidobacteriaceae bacterium]|nr:hypothetical protein [Acidobacteriaceae bacterium]
MRPRAQQPLDASQRRTLLIAAALVGLIKMIEFLLDRQVLFDFDSGGFIMNGLGTGFFSFRSYTYGGLIRLVALPFHTLTPVVALQTAMGGLTAWLLAYALLRNLCVRPWIAIAAAVAFALDPVQILHEHYILSETATLLAAAIFLVAALEYLHQRRLFQLIELSFLAALLVSLRLVYVPLVLVASILVPLLAWFPTRTAPIRFRPLALALLVSCTFTYIFQTGYQHLTGWMAEREPAYDYEAGSFLLAAVAPAVRPNEIRDPRLAQAFEAQRTSRYPLSPDYRDYLLWQPEGLIHRIANALGGNAIAMNAAAAKLGRETILHHPISFLMLGWYNYREYWKGVPSLRKRLLREQTTPMVIADQVDRIFPSFSQYRLNYDNPNSLSRRYLLSAHNWYAFLLASPLILCLALLTKPANPKGVIFLLVWAALLEALTCLLTTYHTLRYLHPFSFTSLIGAALLCQWLLSVLRKPAPLSTALTDKIETYDQEVSAG